MGRPSADIQRNSHPRSVVGPREVSPTTRFPESPRDAGSATGHPRSVRARDHDHRLPGVPGAGSAIAVSQRKAKTRGPSRDIKRSPIVLRATRERRGRRHRSPDQSEWMSLIRSRRRRSAPLRAGPNGRTEAGAGGSPRPPTADADGDQEGDHPPAPRQILGIGSEAKGCLHGEPPFEARPCRSLALEYHVPVEGPHRGWSGMRCSASP